MKTIFEEYPLTFAAIIFLMFAALMNACHKSSASPAGPDACDRQLELCRQDLAICGGSPKSFKDVGSPMAPPR